MFLTKFINKKIVIAAFVFLAFLTIILVTDQNFKSKDYKIKKTFINPGQKWVWLKIEDVHLKRNTLTKQNGLQQQLSTQLGNQELPEEKDNHLNRSTDLINIAYLWIANNKLKVLTVMAINDKTNQAGVVTIPVYTQINGAEQNTTIGEIYEFSGRTGLIKTLEHKMEIKINNYFSIKQSALEKLSNLVGPINVNGENIKMATAFEETSSGKRHDDQDIVRALGKHIMNPVQIVKIPRFLWFAAHNIDSNMFNKDIWHFVNVFKNIDYATMNKVAIDGEESIENGQKIRKVSSETWHNVIYELGLQVAP